MNVVIMMGLPGSGKTTYVAKHLSAYQYFSADPYHVDPDFIYRFKSDMHASFHTLVKRDFALWARNAWLHMERCQNAVVDNTNLDLIDLGFYVETATAFGHTVQILYLYSEKAFARQVHGVPLDAWQAMAERAKLTILSWPERWPKAEIIRT